MLMRKGIRKTLYGKLFNVLWADRGLGFSVAKPKPVVQNSQLEQRKKMRNLKERQANFLQGLKNAQVQVVIGFCFECDWL